MTRQPFEDFADTPTAPSLDCFAITPSDQDDLPAVTKAIYVGEGGSVVLRPVRGSNDVTFRNLPSGYVLDVRVSAIRATGTTATSLIGLI